MSIRVFIPKDAAALSVGAERVAKAVMAEAVIRNIPLELVRTGTRGACWLEPLAEIEIDGVRHGYGPVTPADVPGLFDAGFLKAGAHRLALGPVEELDWFKRQERLTFARCGIIDPLSLDDYAAHGGLVGLRIALGLEPQAIVDDRQAFRPARTRRRGLPDGHQVEHGR